MGIFDIFKTKVSEAAEKVGDVAEQAKDKVSEMMDKSKGGTAPEETATEQGEAANMVSEGAPVSEVGEAAPGVGDDGTEAPAASESGGSGGMTQTIKGNVASGVEKAGEMAKHATGGKFDEKIDTGVQKAKDMLGD